jgi:hypothetical protein
LASRAGLAGFRQLAAADMDFGGTSFLLKSVFRFTVTRYETNCSTDIPKGRCLDFACVKS